MGLAPDRLHGLAVAREDGAEALLHLLAGRHLFERARGEPADDALVEVVFRDVLNDLHELEGGPPEFDGLRRRLVERAVYDVRPVDERGEGRFTEAEALGGDARDELGARLARGVPELLPRGVGAEVRFVFGSQKGRLVVVEPPGEAARGAVLEVDDGV